MAWRQSSAVLNSRIVLISGSDPASSANRVCSAVAKTRSKLVSPAGKSCGSVIAALVTLAFSDGLQAGVVFAPDSFPLEISADFFADRVPPPTVIPLGVLRRT